MAFAVGIADRTPKALASYEQVETTPLSLGFPPTMTGFPLHSGCSLCSTEAKKASMSTCNIFRINTSTCKRTFVLIIATFSKKVKTERSHVPFLEDYE